MTTLLRFLATDVNINTIWTLIMQLLYLTRRNLESVIF